MAFEAVEAVDEAGGRRWKMGAAGRRGGRPVNRGRGPRGGGRRVGMELEV